MSDTSDAVSAMVAAHHRAMTAEARWRAAASLFETARAIVEASLDPDLDPVARRLAVARRLYGGELPEAALIAHARTLSPPTRESAAPAAENADVPGRGVRQIG